MENLVGGLFIAVFGMMVRALWLLSEVHTDMQTIKKEVARAHDRIDMLIAGGGDVRRRERLEAG